MLMVLGTIIFKTPNILIIREMLFGWKVESASMHQRVIVLEKWHQHSILLGQARPNGMLPLSALVLSV
jgi:hypothetical protein